MRGQPDRLGVTESGGRIIPARAGPTTGICDLTRSLADHPRACGANTMIGTFFSPGNGSSPRVRGQLMHNSADKPLMRIIPARAGPTRRRGRCGSRLPDHPRACGANRGEGRFLRFRYGSSPRVRGQRHRRPSRFHGLRIIPERAGPTPRKNTLHHPGQDHPRACGANADVEGNDLTKVGSSPRVRGQHCCRGNWMPAPRIIPARAGPTCLTGGLAIRSSDHPRACGANPSKRCRTTAKHGSSPRVRGQRRGEHRRHDQQRIIPARAGPTRGSGIAGRYPEDHPRACGANRMKTPILRLPNGSSPRVRGQRIRRGFPHSGRRIIPARAGPTYRVRRGNPFRADHPRACGANSQ